MNSDDPEVLRQRIAELERNQKRLQSINQVLIERVETGSTNRETHYAAFEHSVVLAEQVRERTEQLNSALEKLRFANRALIDANENVEMLHQRLIDAIESTSDAFALFDNSGKLVLFNKRYQSNWEGTTGAKIQEGMTRAEVRAVIKKHARIETAISPDKKDKPELVCQLENGRWIRIN